MKTRPHFLRPYKASPVHHQRGEKTHARIGMACNGRSQIAASTRDLRVSRYTRHMYCMLMSDVYSWLST